jgi:DNA-binding MarR family transcriptional regulator
MKLQDYLPYRLNLLAELTSEHTRPIYRRRHGLTRTEWRVLVNLAEAEQLTATDLCRLVPAHKTKVSRALAALEARGWLRRQIDTADHRRAHVRLSPAGRRAVDGIFPQMQAATEALLAPLTGAERDTVSRGLAVLERLFRERCEGLPKT